jgi:hypothetical protein
MACGSGSDVQLRSLAIPDNGTGKQDTSSCCMDALLSRDAHNGKNRIHGREGMMPDQGKLAVEVSWYAGMHHETRTPGRR